MRAVSCKNGLDGQVRNNATSLKSYIRLYREQNVNIEGPRPPGPLLPTPKRCMKHDFFLFKPRAFKQVLACRGSYSIKTCVPRRAL